MFFSKATSIGLKALIAMSRSNPDEYFSVTELSQAIGCSKTYLNKVLHTLVEKGYLKSKTGPNAGYAFIKKPSEINMYEIVEALNNPDYITNCFFGLGDCSDENPCPLHDTYKKFRQDLLKKLSKMSLIDGAKQGWEDLTVPK
ncbi:MAG: Rrf2 family transcriptional regulator [Candidatus Hydrogenedentota bacterium]|nr:MAG: Rrf2 family transcriptional regulator [Candidatus Hydrogenedentota bacterium]